MMTLHSIQSQKGSADPRLCCLSMAGGPINTLLSSQPMAVLSKLTFTAYLIRAWPLLQNRLIGYI